MPRAIAAWLAPTRLATASLVSSRFVSMTFVPLLGAWLLRAPKKLELPVHERRQHGFARLYSLLVHRAIREVVGRSALGSVTTFVGGGGPRFWFSIGPEQRQSNHAQLIIRLEHKESTGQVVRRLQDALTARIPGARVDVQEIESGPAVGRTR